MTKQLKSILVIKLSAFGDMILALPWFEAIRKQNPDAKITLLTTPPLAGFIKGSPYFDEIWVEERWPHHQSYKWIPFMRKLRAGGYDRVFDLQRNARCRFMSYLAPKTLRREWFGRKCGPHYGDMQDPPCPILPSFETVDLSWLQADISRFGLPERFALLVPGCAPQHPEKRWPAEKFAQVAQKLEGQGLRAVLIGTKAEKEALDTIKAAVPSALNLCGQTSFYEIAVLARKAKAAIGNDTGPMHLISLIGCPVVSLFSGKTSPEKSRPRGPRVKTLQSDPIEGIDIDAVLAEVSKI